MHPLEKKVLKMIISHNLITSGQKVLVGVSAGPDSLALLHLLHAMSGRLACELAAAYVDHGLRPAETGAEWQLVREVAARLKISARRGEVPVAAHAKSHGLSLEQAGRELRYRFLADTARELGAERIAVAHTADDQAEELLLRLLRGTGRKGLAGMAPFSRPDRQAPPLLRPLLTTTKAEVLAYLADRRIEFCEDSSNRDRRFLRNRVRLDLLPELAARFNPNIRETLRRTAAILQDEEELLAALTESAWQEAVVAEKGGDAKGVSTGPEVALDLKVIRAQSTAIQRRLLEKALWTMGVPPDFRRIDQLLRGVLSPRGGEVAHLRGGVLARKKGCILELRLAADLGRPRS